MRGGDAESLLVVGPGVLGMRAARVWRKGAGEGATACAKTRTKETAERVATEVMATGDEAGEQARPVFDHAMSEWPSGTGQTYRHVIFSAPPSGNTDYAAEVATAAARTDWSDDSARFVFTSSAGVYACDEGECAESGAVQDAASSPRMARLLDAERAALSAGGCVVRLAGLYHRTRGAHSYYLKLARDGKSAEASGHTLLNLIHYDDAAALVVAALRKGRRGEVYVGADMSPVRRDDMMRATMLAEDEPSGDGVGPGKLFTGAHEGVPPGKSLNNEWTKSVLQWAPVHASFESFIMDR